MSQNLLSMVQKILLSLDSDPVNSITESTEAIQVSSILEDVFYQFITQQTIPEHKELSKLVAASDSEFPTHLKYPAGVTRVDCLWYDTSDDSSFDYTELTWLEPYEFLSLTDGRQSNYKTVLDKNGGTSLRIKNNQQPGYYTSFDDEWLVLDSWDSSVEATIQSSKTRAMVNKTPEWQAHVDSFVPDIDSNVFPLLIAEAKLIAEDELHGDPSTITNRNATRLRAGYQTRKRKNERSKNWSRYGR